MVSSRVRVRIRVKVRVRVSVMVRVSIRTRWVVNFALVRCYRPVIYTRPRNPLPKSCNPVYIHAHTVTYCNLLLTLGAYEPNVISCCCCIVAVCLDSGFRFLGDRL